MRVRKRGNGPKKRKQKKPTSLGNWNTHHGRIFRCEVWEKSIQKQKSKNSLMIIITLKNFAHFDAIPPIHTLAGFITFYRILVVIHSTWQYNTCFDTTQNEQHIRTNIGIYTGYLSSFPLHFNNHIWYVCCRFIAFFIYSLTKFSALLLQFFHLYSRSSPFLLRCYCCHDIKISFILYHPLNIQ